MVQKLKKNYKIYDLLSIQINTIYKSLMTGLNNPLSFFEVNEEIHDPDIRLNIGRFIPSYHNCYIVDHKYHVKKDYLYCKDSDGKSKWEVEINGFEKSPTIINFYGKPSGKYHYLAPDLLAQDNILLPLIELVLGSKGYLLAHGCGIVEKDEAIVFLGRGGSLKTTIVLNALKSNLKIFGDDRLILDTKNKMVYSFPIFPRIFEYISRNSDDEYLTLSKKILLALDLIRSTSTNSTNSIWQKDPTYIKSIYFIKRKNIGGDKIKVQSVEKDIAIKKIIANNKAEMYSSSIPSIKKRNFPEFILAYSYIFPDSMIANYWKRCEISLYQLLKNANIFELTLPEIYNFKSLEKYWKERCI